MVRCFEVGQGAFCRIRSCSRVDLVCKSRSETDSVIQARFQNSVCIVDIRNLVAPVCMRACMCVRACARARDSSIAKDGKSG